MQVSIFGMGYVGVVSAACLAREGHDVIGVDISPGKVEMINAGRSPVIESGLNELVGDMVAAGRLSATSNAGEAVARTAVSIVSVGTPSDRGGSTSLAAIDAVAKQIAGGIAGKNTAHTVVVRSTVPPGTIDNRIAPLICAGANRERGRGLEICSNPEFLREGTAIRDFRRPPFTLVGCDTEVGFATMREMYAGIDAPLIRTNVRTAEAVKYLCNAFHAIKIGFANEVGSLLKSLEIDAREAMSIFCEDRALNISPAYLRPGFAFGGSCLPKDVRALTSLARANHIDLPLIGNLLISNERHIDRAFDMIARGGRRRIALFGLAFKPGTDDMRESPLVVLAERLIGKGFDLTIFDRDVDLARIIGANREYIDREIPHLERLLRPTPEAAMDGAATLVIGHVSAAEIEAILRNHHGRTIIDLQGVKELESLAGADYQGICW